MDVSLFSTEAEKGQSQNIYEIRKKNFKIRKNISNRNVFLEIIVEGFIKSEKLFTNLDKIIESRNIILQIPNKFANPRIVAKSRKILCKSEKIFCHVLLAPAVSQRQSLFPPFCLIQNGRGTGVGKEFVIVYNMKYDVLP